MLIQNDQNSPEVGKSESRKEKLIILSFGLSDFPTSGLYNMLCKRN